MPSIFNYPKFHAETALGLPLVGGKVYTYAPGTTTPKASYQDAAMAAANTNPVILDANGDAVIYLNGVYDVVLKDSSDVSQWTMSSVTGDNTSASYEVDVLYDYGGGTTYTQAVIDLALAAVGTSTKTTLVLRPGTWVISSNANWSAYSNVNWKLPNGAILQIATGTTTTLAGSIEAGLYQVFSCVGTGKVVFGSGSVAEVHSEWFGSTAASITKALSGSGSIPVSVSTAVTCESTISIGDHQTFINRTTLTADPTLATGMITNSDASGGNHDIKIIGGKYNGLGATQTTCKEIIGFSNVSDSLIDGVEISNGGASAGTDTPAGIHIDASSKNVDIKNFRIIDTYAMGGIRVYQSSHIHISDGYLENTTGIVQDSPITVDGSPYSSVKNCTIINYTASGISFNSKYGEVRGNILIAGAQELYNAITLGHDDAINSATGTIADGNQVYGIKTTGAHGIAVQGVDTEGVIVTNNTIYGGDAVAHTNIIGIYLYSETGPSIVANNKISRCWNGIRNTGVNGAVIKGNIVENSSGLGIAITGNSNNTITDNKVINSGLGGVGGTEIGIYTHSDSVGNVITGNRCFDNQTPKTQTTGIYVSTAGNVISNNVVSGNSAYGVSVGALVNAVNGNIADATGNNYYSIPVLADDATPSILNGYMFLTGGTTTITNFDDGYVGQKIHIISEHSITITDGTNIFLAGSANFVMAASDTLTLVRKADGKWYEIGRSDN